MWVVTCVVCVVSCVLWVVTCVLWSCELCFMSRELHSVSCGAASGAAWMLSPAASGHLEAEMPSVEFPGWDWLSSYLGWWEKVGRSGGCWRERCAVLTQSACSRVQRAGQGACGLESRTESQLFSMRVSVHPLRTRVLALPPSWAVMRIKGGHALWIIKAVPTYLMSQWDLGCIVWLTGGAGGLCFLMKVRSSRKEGVQQLGPQRTRRIQSPRTQGPAPLSSFHWIFSLKTRISGQTLGNLKSQACICNRESQCWTALCHPLCKPTHSYSRPLSHLLQGQRKDLTWEGSKLIPPWVPDLLHVSHIFNLSLLCYK